MILYHLTFDSQGVCVDLQRYLLKLAANPASAGLESSRNTALYLLRRLSLLQRPVCPQPYPLQNNHILKRNHSLIDRYFPLLEFTRKAFFYKTARFTLRTPVLACVSLPKSIQPGVKQGSRSEQRS